MDFSSEMELRQELARCLHRECSIKDFEEWFVPRSWDFNAASDSLRDLVAQIELALAEFANGDWSELELRRHFNATLTYYRANYPVNVGSVESVVKTATSASALELHLTFPQSTVDIQFSAVHV